MTLTEIAAYLRTDPETFLLLKRFMLDAKVAGEWVLFDSSQESKDRKIGRGPHAWVRFTPVKYDHHMASGVVVEAAKKGWVGDEPERYDYGGEFCFFDEEEYEKDLAKWKKQTAGKKTHPFRWKILGSGRKGGAVTLDGAKEAANKALKKKGWILPISDLERIAAVKGAK